MNYVKKYYRKIEDGSVIVPVEIREVYKRMVSEMDDKTSVFYFDENTGEHIIKFIETFCRHYEGEFAGELVRLELWQKAFIQNTFGWLEKKTGRRRFREYLLEVPRKHGKSFLSGCIATYMLVADGESGAQIYTLATKLDQAKIVYDVARAIIEQSKDLRSLVKATRDGMRFGATRSVMRALASESKTMDGLNVHFACLDELHQIRDRNLYDVIRQGMKARRQPLLGIITTAGFLREGIYDTQHDYAVRVAIGEIKDDRLFPVVYKLDNKEEWTDPEMWSKANPGLGTIKSRQQLADDVEKAKHDSSYLPTLLCKDFNIRETATGSWLTFEDVKNTETYDLNDHRGTYCVGGVDLSSTTDLTCATLLWTKDGKLYVAQMYFIPRDIAEAKEREDKVPYGIWEQQGWVTYTDGARVDYADVTAWFVRMRDEYELFPLWIGYDNWNAGYFTTDMQNNNFVMEVVIQGAKTMSPAMKQMEAEFRSKNIVYDNNPILKWNLTNTQVKADDNNNIRPVKGRNAKQRIDGTVSLIDSFVVYMRHHDDYHNLVD